MTDPKSSSHIDLSEQGAKFPYHCVMHQSSGFFNTDEEQRIIETIRCAEGKTTGEIRVHLECHSDEDVLDRAAVVFEQLEMFETKDRTGVLIYLAINDREFAVIGDIGINKHLPNDYWDKRSSGLKKQFAAGQFCDGLVELIEDIGIRLREFYPIEDGDTNELSDEISYGK